MITTSYARVGNRCVYIDRSRGQIPHGSVVIIRVITPNPAGTVDMAPLFIQSVDNSIRWTWTCHQHLDPHPYAPGEVPDDIAGLIRVSSDALEESGHPEAASLTLGLRAAADEVQRREMEREEMLEMLKAVEWDQAGWVRDAATIVCPSCHSYQWAGHSNDCRLADLLARLTRPLTLTEEVEP